MRVTVVVPAFNAAEYLTPAVESLMATGHDALEILIIDDGSNDSTPAVAAALARRYPTQVVLLTTAKRGGASAARNLGIQRATGELVCFLDADDLVLPHRFRAALLILGSRPEVDAVYELAEVTYEGEAARDEWTGYSEIFGVREPLSGVALIEVLMSGTVWPTSGIIVRRKLLDRAGSFPENLRIAEDCHLWFRMALIGTVVPGEIGRPVSIYRRHQRNTFHPGEVNKVAMVRAMASVHRWARATPVDTDRLDAFRRAAAVFVRRAMLASAEMGRPDVALRVLALGIAGGLLSFPSAATAIRPMLGATIRTTIRATRRLCRS